MPSWTSWLDHTLNGLIIGNVYAMLAVGLPLIFGVSNLINFAHGSVYTVGAFIGWAAITYLHTPLLVTMALVVLGTGLLGMLIERVGLRPLANSPRIAPLLATIGISFVLDQLVQLLAGPDPRALPNPLPDWRLQLGGGSIGALDLLIAAIGLSSALVLFGFLRFTRLGWAVRATAQDRDAAQQMGVNINAVNQAVFAIASALGGLAGLLVGMYYNNISPAMSLQATLKGVVAVVIGGVGNVPGAIAGSLLLGLTESWGVALFGTPYRNLFAFLLLIAVLVWRPNGLFGSRRILPPEPLTGTFIAPSKPLEFPRWLGAAVVALLFALPLLVGSLSQASYVLTTLTNGCPYCASVHARLFVQLSKEPQVIDDLFEQGVNAALAPGRRAILDLAIVLSAKPPVPPVAQVQTLRSLGLDDLQVPDAIHAAAIFAWANRLMQTLGQPVLSHVDRASDSPLAPPATQAHEKALTARA